MTGRAPGHPGLGITLILLMAACFAAMDTAVKYVGALLHILVVLLARYGVQAASMGLWLAVAQLRGGAGFRAAHPRFQAVRGVLLLLSSTFGFFGLQYLPVAEFTAITMLTPVMVTLLAATLLHEHVSRRRWLLVGGGLTGALIVIRPGSGLFGWAALLPIAGSMAYASFQVLTRKLASLESPFTTHFYTGLTGSLIVALALLASEVELLLFKCPAVQEACVISARDDYRGETVKAVVVLRRRLAQASCGIANLRRSASPSKPSSAYSNSASLACGDNLSQTSPSRVPPSLALNWRSSCDKSVSTVSGLCDSAALWLRTDTCSRSGS